MEFEPVSSLDQDWQRLLRGPLPARLRAWADHELALAPFAADPVRLIAFLRGSAPAAAKDELLVALVRIAADEPLAARVVLEAIVPGMARLAERIIFDARDRDELWALLLGHAWQLIRRYPLARRPRRIAANLLLDTRRAALADLAEERRERREPTRRCSCAAASSGGGVEALLRRTVAAGALSGQEAELILETRIDGVSLARLAAESGIPYHTLNVRRLRAERRLLLFLGHPRPVGRPVSSGRRSAAPSRGLRTSNRPPSTGL
jgi:DNA-directed RNA polymerase specialized sigma24 family protein